MILTYVTEGVYGKEKLKSQNVAFVTTVNTEVIEVVKKLLILEAAVLIKTIYYGNTMKNSFFYIVYDKNELPAAICDNLEELTNFLEKPNKDDTKSCLCRYFKGLSQFIFDKQMNKYTLFKVEK